MALFFEVTRTWTMLKLHALGRERPLDLQELTLPIETKDPYTAAVSKLVREGFTFDTKTCFYERGVERLELRWNGKVYARRRGPPKPAAPSPGLMSAFGREVEGR